MGEELTNKTIVQQRRGRVGLIFIITGFIFLLYGSAAMIHVPSVAHEQDILQNRKLAKRRERMEMASEVK